MKDHKPNFLDSLAFPEPPPTPKVRLSHAPMPKVHVATASHTRPMTPVTTESAEHAHTKQRPKRRRFGRWIALGVVAAVLVLTVPAGIALAQAYTSAQAAKAALDRVAIDVQKLDMEAAKIEMERAQMSLRDARDALQRVGFWRDIPGIGVQLRALEDAAAAGAQTLDGMHDVIAVIEVVTDALRGGVLAAGSLEMGVAPTRRYQDLSAQEKRDVLAKFANALPELRIARDKIDLALELWARVPQQELVAPLRTALQPVADILPRLKQALDEGTPIIEALVPLAGYPQKMRYLVLLQNSDELRPGGGFIGTVGTMTMDAGDLSELNFIDVYNIDNPATPTWKETPPQPIVERLGVRNWFLRDANWSPDFPSSAEKQLDFFTRERAAAGVKETDPPTAVIAIEPGFFKALLHLTGPVVVDGKTFNENNFMERIEYEVEAGFLKEGIPLEKRKDLIGKIGAALVEKLKAIPTARWNEITDVMTKALQRKQLMVYARDPKILSILDTRGWTARAKPTSGDFLWVIDANLAALKTDGMMDKQVSYMLDARDPQHPTATVTLTYKNNVQHIDWRYTRYRSYTRVYVPEGSQLISSTGSMKDDRYKTGGVAVAGRVDVAKELGKTVFGTFWSIEPAHTGTLSFTYSLPPSALAGLVDTGVYHLDWPKQAGADLTTLTLDLKFGKTVISAAPPEDRTMWGDARYQLETDTLQDRVFDVKF